MLSLTLRGIRVPTLVVCGQQDYLVPEEDCGLIHESIPNSELLVLEKSGHGADGADIQVFHETVLQFLARLAN